MKANTFGKLKTFSTCPLSLYDPLLRNVNLYRKSSYLEILIWAYPGLPSLFWGQKLTHVLCSVPWSVCVAQGRTGRGSSVEDWCYEEAVSFPEFVPGGISPGKPCTSVEASPEHVTSILISVDVSENSYWMSYGSLVLSRNLRLFKYQLYGRHLPK